MTRRRIASTLGVLALGAAAGLGCSRSLGIQWDLYHDAVRRWNQANLDDYSFEYRYECFCPSYGLALITVEDGVVTSSEWIDGPIDDVRPDPPEHTIEELFAMTRDGLRRRPDHMTSAYDEAIGYPSDIHFDFEENTADEEWGFIVRNFTPL